jgi:hypothetical protein
MYLGDQREEYDMIIFSNLMKENPDLLRCVCGNIIDSEEEEKGDDNTNLIKREPAEN